MNNFRKGGIALTLALLAAAIPQQAQALCCTTPSSWQFWLSYPTAMDEFKCIAGKTASASYYPAIALATIAGARYGFKGAKWAVSKSPRTQAMMAWAQSKLSRKKQTPGLMSRMGSTLRATLKPFGDTPEYAPGYWKPAQAGKWLLTTKDADGNPFEITLFYRMKPADSWSGKRYAVTSTAQATKDRVAAIRARFGAGRIGNAMVGASNFMNNHPWVSNAVYYPALAAAGYYGFKGAELAYEKVAELWNDYQAQDVLSGIIDKANEQLVSTGAATAKAPLSTAVQEDAGLVEQIEKMPMPRQIALKAAMTQFDKAFSLQNPQARATALNQAIDTISTVCNAA